MPWTSLPKLVMTALAFWWLILAVAGVALAGQGLQMACNHIRIS